MVRERQNHGGTESWDFTGVNILLRTESLTQRAQRPQRKKEVRRPEEQDKFGASERLLHLHKKSCRDCKNVTDCSAKERGNRQILRTSFCALMVRCDTRPGFLSLPYTFC